MCFQQRCQKFIKEMIVFSINNVGIIRYSLKILNHYFMSFTKFNSKWTVNLNIRAKTRKVLEENIGEHLYHLRMVKYFLGHRKQKPLNDVKLHFIRIKNFCFLKILLMAKIFFKNHCNLT